VRAAPAKQPNYADAACPRCLGAGRTNLFLEGEYVQRQCECTVANYALHRIHQLLGPVEFELGGGPLFGQRAWVTGLSMEDVARHLAVPLYRLFAESHRGGWRCVPRMLTDLQIREAYFTPTRPSKTDAEPVTELDRLIPPEAKLFIIQLGQASKHNANGTALAEFLAKLKGTKIGWERSVWICDSLWKPYDSRHPSYNEEVSRWLGTDFRRVELCESEAADAPELASVACL
jgi:hypothetical protein